MGISGYMIFVVLSLGLRRVSSRKAVGELDGGVLLQYNMLSTKVGGGILRLRRIRPNKSRFLLSNNFCKSYSYIESELNTSS